MKFMINQKKNYNANKDIRIKIPMLRSDVHIVVKRTITVIDPDNTKRNESGAFKTMHHLSATFKKLIVYKLSIQEIWIL